MNHVVGSHTTESAGVQARAWSPAEAAAFMNDLRSQLRELGVFRGDKRGYIVRSVFVLAVAALAWLGFLWADAGATRLAIAVLAAYIGVQAAAIAHEAGHGAVTRNRAWTQFVGRLFMTVVMGASYTAWVERHGAHHIHPNSRKDPDVRPWLFSFNETDARNATGLAGWCTRHQDWLLIPLSSLMGFSLKLSGWQSVLRKTIAYPLDLALLMLHLGVWIALPALWIGLADALVNYALVTWLEGIYLAFVFLTNHLGTPTGEEARHYPPALRQIVTARNLPASWWMTHICVGLNTHIEHHLFGHVPATRLPEARATTRRLCEARGIPYRECTLGEALAEVHRYNRRVASIARQAALERRARLCNTSSA
jgi:fatty acid desaturase